MVSNSLPPGNWIKAKVKVNGKKETVFIHPENAADFAETITPTIQKKPKKSPTQTAHAVAAMHPVVGRYTL